MNRQFTVYRRLHTTEPPNVVYDAIEESLRLTVGGAIERRGNTFFITNGTKNVNFAFVAEFTAEISLTQPAPDIVDVQGTITIRPNTFFWVSLVIGFFCLWFLWVFNVFYFVMDPRMNYQTALDRVQLKGDPAYGA
ncbi:MAG TPA: hypothetical protein VF787_18755 [Thermoanaerobaculia bacterium]